MSVDELRAALDSMERNWSAQDLEVLGEFGRQEICIDVFDAGKYLGIGTPEPAYFDCCFGVMLLADGPQRKEKG